MNSDFSLLHLFFDFLFLSCSFQLYKFIRWRWWRCLTGIGQYIYMYFHIYEVRIVNVICSTYYVVCGGTAVHIFVSFDVTIAAPESLLKYNFETWNFLETVWWDVMWNVCSYEFFSAVFFFFFSFHCEYLHTPYQYSDTRYGTRIIITFLFYEISSNEHRYHGNDLKLEYNKSNCCGIFFHLFSSRS